MFTQKILKSVLLTSVLLTGAASADSLFSLENLERERASLISTMSDPALSMDERQRKAKMIYRRMVDIERMVLRDERIASSDKLIVKKAFANYTPVLRASETHTATGYMPLTSHPKPSAGVTWEYANGYPTATGEMESLGAYRRW